MAPCPKHRALYLPQMLAAGTKLHYIRLLAGLGLVLSSLPPPKTPTVHYKDYLQPVFFNSFCLLTHSLCFIVYFMFHLLLFLFAHFHPWSSFLSFPLGNWCLLVPCGCVGCHSGVFTEDMIFLFFSFIVFCILTLFKRRQSWNNHNVCTCNTNYIRAEEHPDVSKYKNKKRWDLAHYELLTLIRQAFVCTWHQA